jgi:hypothetical protein
MFTFSAIQAPVYHTNANQSNTSILTAAQEFGKLVLMEEDGWDIAINRTYDVWRAKILDLCLRLPARMCPFCGEIYEDTAEYVDVGVGSVQVTGNYCDNPECGAQEQGQYKYEGDEWEFCCGWVRHKYDRPSRNSVNDFIEAMNIPFNRKQKLKAITDELFNEVME